MIVHETVGKQMQLEFSDGLGKDLEKSFPVDVVENNRALLHPTIVNVVEGTCEKDPVSSGHGDELYNIFIFHTTPKQIPSGLLKTVINKGPGTF